MLTKINAWYSQSSNQLALAGLVFAIGKYLQHSITAGDLISAAVAFAAVALKNQAASAPVAAGETK